MLLKSFFYKALNKLCAADITQVLFLDKRTFLEPVVAEEVVCHRMDCAALEALARNGNFALPAAFLEDFVNHSFHCVAASVNSEVIGLIFLGEGEVPARHNSGGSLFNGIGVATPKGAFYLFKVDVLESHRGKRANAAMIAYAVKSLASEGLESIVTTTDWTNQAFLKSASRLGFVRSGHASEFVFKGHHRYLLPKPLHPESGIAVNDAKLQKSGLICFSGA